MLIEHSAYCNRWRSISPQAKFILAGMGLMTAFAAPTPQMALWLALGYLLLTCLGGGVPFRLYLRVAAPAAGFLALSCLTLLVSVGEGGVLHRAAQEQQQVAMLASRSLASLAALLGLVLTTPLPDLLGVFRRWRCPEVLLDLMVLCYQTLFVLLQTLQQVQAAQQARLGYARRETGWRSLGQLIAHLSLQIWQRAHALHRAALARNGGQSLHFMPMHYAHERRDTLCALLIGSLLLLLVVGLGDAV